MMINNAKQYLKNTDPNATIKSTDDKPLNAFDISNVLSIVTGKLKEDIIKRVFEPYFTTKHQSQGTGIGLYMSEEIITKHMDGVLEVENTSYEFEGENFIGALFIITMPLK